MSSLGETYLRQGRSFLRAGDPRRAVELLEKARATARDDQRVLRDATAELARAYEQVGDSERAALCRERLEFLPADTPPQQELLVDVPPGGSAAPAARRRWSPWATAALIAVAVALHVGMFLWYRSWRAGQDAQIAAPPPATQPATAPAPEPVVVAPPTPVVLPAVPATTAAAVPPSLDSIVTENVALLVVLGHYRGSFEGRQLSLDVPISNGTAFVVDPAGVLLTNRHVVETAKDKNLPASLEEAGLPTVTLRSTSYLACFGRDRSQQIAAKLVHSSEKYDLAVLTAERSFASPLRFSPRPPRLGDEIFVAGFPGIVQQMFDAQFQTDARFAEAVAKLRSTGSVNLMSELFSPEAFNATVTRGVISTAERHLDGVAHTQFDARVSGGNSGGPVLGADRQVVAIVTKGGTGAAQGYNFGLLVRQLRDELAQWTDQK